MSLNAVLCFMMLKQFLRVSQTRVKPNTGPSVCSSYYIDDSII